MASACRCWGAVSVLGWADNILFLSRSSSAAQRSVDIFRAGLHQMGMHWKASSIQCLSEGAVRPTTAGTKRKADDPTQLPREHGPDDDTGTPTDPIFWTDLAGGKHQVERVTQMELLGCLITTDNRAAVQHLSGSTRPSS